MHPELGSNPPFESDRESGCDKLDLPQAVCEYKDVFLDKLPGLPSCRDVDFTIELHLSTSPISMHRMGPIELQELKVQL